MGSIFGVRGFSRVSSRRQALYVSRVPCERDPRRIRAKDLLDSPLE